MRKTLFAALAAAAILATAAPIDHVQAITLAARPQLGLAAADAGIVQKAAWRCGWRGCIRGPVWHRYYRGYPRAYPYAYPHPFPYFMVPRIPIWIRPYPWPGPWIRPWGYRGWRYRY
jgi:hypothetical protein